MRGGHWRVGWVLGSPLGRGARGRGCPVLGHPALHLFCCPRKAGGAQLTPESHHVVDNVAPAASDFVLILSVEELRLRGGRANAAGLKPSSRPGLARPVE